MFPAEMFTWVGWGLQQHQPCCAMPGTAAPELHTDKGLWYTGH